MNMMNRIGSVFSCILFSAGILLFVIQDLSNRIVLDTIVDVIVDRMVSASLNQVLPEDLRGKIDDSLLSQAEELSGPLSSEIKNQINDVKTEMMQSDYLQAMSKKYIDVVLDQLIDGEAQLPDVSADIQDLAQEYVPQLSQTLGVEISDEMMDQAMNAITQRVDINGILDDMTQKMQVRLTTSQKNVLRLIRFFNQGSLIWLSLITMVIAAALLFYHTRGLSWFAYLGTAISLCAVLFIACGKIIPLLWQKTSNPLIEILSSTGSAMMELLFWYGVWMLGIGVLLWVIYLGSKAFIRWIMTK